MCGVHVLFKHSSVWVNQWSGWSYSTVLEKAEMVAVVWILYSTGNSHTSSLAKISPLLKSANYNNKIVLEHKQYKSDN